MASGDTLLVFGPHDNEPPEANYATFDTILVASSDEPDDVIAVLDFDPGVTNEHAEFSGIMPRHYGGGGLTCTIYWSSDATGSVNCRWELAWKSVSDDADDLDTKAFAAPNSGNFQTASAAGEVDYATITFTDGADMDSVGAGEYFRLRLTRDSADAADTMNSNDAEFIRLEIRET